MIDFSSIKDSEGKPIAFVVTIDGKESMEAFKKLVFRATNLWPDATAEIKIFADEVEHGKALQDYASQDTSPKKPTTVSVKEVPPVTVFQCMEMGGHFWNNRSDSNGRCTKCGFQPPL